MGTFRVKGEVAAIATPDEFVPVERMLVDSGSEFSWIPESLLKKAGVTVAKRDRSFVMADGETIKRTTGYAILRASGFEANDEVVFGKPGDLVILGARTLEGFGALVDAERKVLAAAGPYPAAASEDAPLRGGGGN